MSSQAEASRYILSKLKKKKIKYVSPARTPDLPPYSVNSLVIFFTDGSRLDIDPVDWKTQLVINLKEKEKLT